MGVRAYQLHLRESPERNEGDCEADEEGPRSLNSQGCSGLEFLVQTEVFETFTGTKDGTTTTANGYLVYITRVATSQINQANADALAQAAVNATIDQFFGATVAPGVYGDGEAIVIDPNA